MNYIQHTRTAHEYLSRQPLARPYHVSLYWVLFYQWNAARFPSSLDLDHQATMQAARIGNERTYRATLYDLDAWGLLTYQPSQSRHERSRCFLADLSEAEVPPIGQSTPGRSATSWQPSNYSKSATLQPPCGCPYSLLWCPQATLRSPPKN